MVKRWLKSQWRHTLFDLQIKASHTCVIAYTLRCVRVCANEGALR